MVMTIEFCFEDDGSITAETGEKEETETQGEEKPVASIDEAVALLKSAYQAVQPGNDMGSPEDIGMDEADTMKSAYEARNGGMR